MTPAAMRFVSRCAAWLAVLSGVLAGVLALLAWQRTRLPYGEEGNHFEAGVNLNEQGALALVVLAVAALLLALGLYALHRKTRRPR